MQTQSISPRTVTAASGMIMPATITAETDMNLMVTAISRYHSFNERKTDYGTLEEVMMAMRDGSAVVTLYTDAKGEQAARVLWPASITLSGEHNITCKGGFILTAVTGSKAGQAKRRTCRAPCRPARHPLPTRGNTPMSTARDPSCRSASDREQGGGRGSKRGR